MTTALVAAKPLCPHLQRSFDAAVDAPIAINDKACAADHASPLIKSAPVLVIEVLSPSTAAYDRGEKFAHYRRLESLQEYMLVDIDTRRTDLYRKGVDTLWVLHPFDGGQTVNLASVALSITAETLFAEVEPPVVGTA